jgi:AraC family transcriptional regulator
MDPTLPSGRFCGTCLRRREAGGLLVLETRYARGHHTEPHAHAQASFSLVLEGGFEHRTRGATVGCGPATLLLHDAGEVHSEDFHRDAARCLVVELGAQWLQRTAGWNGSLGGFALHGPGPAAALARQIHGELRQADDVAGLAIEGLVLQLLAAVRRTRSAERHPAPNVAKARDLLHARFMEPLGLQDLAEATGLHPVSVAQAFRKAHGVSAGAYQRRLRIEFACRELLRGRRTLAEIALAAGFYDQSHFTRTFRRLVGTTPARYRADATH